MHMKQAGAIDLELAWKWIARKLACIEKLGHGRYSWTNKVAQLVEHLFAMEWVYQPCLELRPTHPYKALTPGTLSLRGGTPALQSATIECPCVMAAVASGLLNDNGYTKVTHWHCFLLMYREVLLYSTKFSVVFTHKTLTLWFTVQQICTAYFLYLDDSISHVQHYQNIYNRTFLGSLSPEMQIPKVHRRTFANEINRNSILSFVSAIPWHIY